MIARNIVTGKNLRFTRFHRQRMPVFPIHRTFLSGRSFLKQLHRVGSFAINPKKAMLPSVMASVKLISAASVVVVLAADIAIAYHGERKRLQTLRSAFAKGSVANDGINNAEFVQRPEVTAAIEKVLTPRQWYHGYDLIVGKHGTGKTSLVRSIGHQLPGIIYVDIPPTRKGFDFALIDALRWTPPVSSWSRGLIDRLVNRNNPEIDPGQPLYSQVLQSFRETAREYRQQRQRPPVIVFDNVNYLARHSPELLWELQQMAKGAADRCDFVVVFVCSEGRAPLQLFGDSAKSRIGSMVEISDLTSDEARRYLVQCRNISVAKGEEVYEQIGGRVNQLQLVADGFELGRELSESVRLLNIDVERNFRNCGLLSDESWATVGWEIAGIIIRDGAISTEEYYGLFQDDEKAQQLLMGNVFTLQPGRNTVTFDCKIAEKFARKQYRRRGHQDWRVRLRRMFLGNWKS